MPYITEIKGVGALNTALQSFQATCSANALALGLDPADLAEITGAATGLNTKLNAWTAAKSTAGSARQAKDAQKSTSAAIVSKWARVFRANQSVPDSLLEQLMLAPHDTPASQVAPAEPLDLVARGNGNGNIKLTWRRNGNIYGTVFVIEYRTSAGGPWLQLGTSTRRTFETQWTPGTYIGFRVTAQRRGVQSPASTPVALWESESTQELRVAA
jgi:hypothetical protein